jgi:hypothetical protein
MPAAPETPATAPAGLYAAADQAIARRHKVAGRGTHRFSLDVVYGQHGLLRLERLPLTAPLCASR